MFNPFIKNINTLIVYLLLWGILLAAHVLVFNFVLGLTYSNAMLDGSVFYIIYIGIGLSLWYPARFITFENYSPFKVIVNHIASALITSGFWIIAGYNILAILLASDSSYLVFLKDSLIWRFVQGFVFYLIIIVSDYLIIYYNNFREKALKEAELKSLVKEAELKSLKYQINPHFIFNSLNSISSLTIANPGKAQEMTIKLSSFMRSTLSKNEKQMSTLKQEIANAKLYLDIEKIRFDDKFEFTENLSKECETVEVPSMILQPLFENAIKHGVYESLEKVTINLSCERSGEYMLIKVENDFDPTAVSQKGEGIGLENIKLRLGLIYKQDNLLTFSKSKNTFTVKLYIPISKKEIENV